MRWCDQKATNARKRSMSVKTAVLMEILIAFVMVLVITGNVAHQRNIRNIQLNTAERERVWNPGVEMKSSERAYEKAREDFDSLNRYSSDEEIVRVCKALLKADEDLRKTQNLVKDNTKDPDVIRSIEETQTDHQTTDEKAKKLLEEVRKQVSVKAERI